METKPKISKISKCSKLYETSQLRWARLKDVEFGVGISKIYVDTMETMQKGQNFEFSQNIPEHQC